MNKNGLVLEESGYYKGMKEVKSFSKEVNVVSTKLNLTFDILKYSPL